MVDPNDDDCEDRDEQRERSSTARGYDAAITFAVEVAVPTLLGYWGDTKLGWMPALTIAGLALGFGAGLYHLLRTIDRGR
jgi:F0F1-type ATP synthase assembly protein I